MIDEARLQAVTASMLGADNYLVLHNVACIYGRLSQSSPAHRLSYEDMALMALKRAVALSEANPTGPNHPRLCGKRTPFPFRFAIGRSFNNCWAEAHPPSDDRQWGPACVLKL